MPIHRIPPRSFLRGGRKIRSSPSCTCIFVRGRRPVAGSAARPVDRPVGPWRANHYHFIITTMHWRALPLSAPRGERRCIRASFHTPPDPGPSFLLRLTLPPPPRIERIRIRFLGGKPVMRRTMRIRRRLSLSFRLDSSAEGCFCSVNTGEWIISSSYYGEENGSACFREIRKIVLDGVGGWTGYKIRISREGLGRMKGSLSYLYYSTMYRI